MMSRRRELPANVWACTLAVGVLAVGLAPTPAVAAGIQLSDVAAGTGGFAMSGRGSFDYTGCDVAGAGDVNGDGIADLIVGARNASPGPTFSGVTYVVFGKSTGNNIPLSSVFFGAGGFAIKGAANGDQSGNKVSTAGDVNGDGLCDIIVSKNDAGIGEQAFVVFGKTDTGIVELSAVAAGVGGFPISHGAGGFGLLTSVSGAGDVNGDGLADLIVGASGSSSPGRILSGVAFVIFGKTTTSGVFLDNVSLGFGGFGINGAEAYDYVGGSVSAAGDVNGDGLADLAIGGSSSYYNGSPSKAYVVFGKVTTALVDLSAVEAGLGGFQISNSDLGPCMVAGAGDVNGDGLADVVVGTPGYSQPSGLSDVGRAFVVFGKTSTTGLALTALQGANAGFSIDANSPTNAYLGLSVSGAGDINGDGLADVIVGQSPPLAVQQQGSPAAPKRANGVVPAAAFVVFGKTTSTPVSTSALDTFVGGFAIENEQSGDLAGHSVAGAGDVNGDGRADVVIGAPRNGIPALNSGRAYVLFGSGTFATSGTYRTAIRSQNAFIKGVGTHRFGADDTIFPDSRAWIDVVTGAGFGVGSASIEAARLDRFDPSPVAGLLASQIADVSWTFTSTRIGSTPAPLAVTNTALVNTELTFTVRYTNAEIAGLTEANLVPYVSLAGGAFAPSATFTRDAARNTVAVRLPNSTSYPVRVILVEPPAATPTPTPTPSPTPSPSPSPTPTPSPTPSPTPTPTPTPTPSPTPSPTPTVTPVGTACLPFIKTAGLGVIIDSPDCDPTFVAYFVQFGNTFVYQGDSGWFDTATVEVVFPQWPYRTLPLMLQGYAGDPEGGVAGIYPLGQTVLSGKVESGWLTPTPTPTGRRARAAAGLPPLR